MATSQLIIEHVKKYPLLYDVEHPDYKNLSKRNKIWDDIGIELEISGYELKKKWRNLRDSYAKYLRGIKRLKRQNVKKNYGRWQWAKEMEIFKPYLSFTKSDSNISIPNSDQFMNVNTETPAIGTYSKKKPDYVLKRKHEDSNRIVSEVNRVLNYSENQRKCTEMDATELVFLGYAKTIKQFTPQRQASVKLKIAEIIIENELQHHDDVSESTISRPSSSGFITEAPYFETISPLVNIKNETQYDLDESN